MLIIFFNFLTSSTALTNYCKISPWNPFQGTYVCTINICTCDDLYNNRNNYKNSFVIKHYCILPSLYFFKPAVKKMSGKYSQISLITFLSNNTHFKKFYLFNNRIVTNNGTKSEYDLKMRKGRNSLMSCCKQWK